MKTNSPVALIAALLVTFTTGCNLLHSSAEVDSGAVATPTQPEAPVEVATATASAITTTTKPTHLGTTPARASKPDH